MTDAYPQDWDDRRRRVYERDNYECQNCGAKGGDGLYTEGVEVHAHHTVPISKGGSHSLSNLRTLCAPCHNAIHDTHAYAPTADEISESDNAEAVELNEDHSSTIRKAMIGTAILGLFAGGPIVAITAALIVGAVLTLFYSLF